MSVVLMAVLCMVFPAAAMAKPSEQGAPEFSVSDASAGGAGAPTAEALGDPTPPVVQGYIYVGIEQILGFYYWVYDEIEGDGEIWIIIPGQGGS